MIRRVVVALALIGASVLALAGAQGATAAKTVEISGRAFVFNHMSTGISNATIRVREFPMISTTTDEFGDYVLKVPDNSTVTPYIKSGGPADLIKRDKDGEVTGTMLNTHWNEIDLQTFHTRGENIENANFQTPRDQEYNILKGILSVPSRPDGRPEQCVIVTTASARNVRDVDFRTYWINTPHGVEGATSEAFPSLPAPTYFNQYVVPDPAQPHSSHDGGIIWPVVPAGTYRIVTTHPDTQFASFLATCEPGRVINANPPMGAYQLDAGEKPRTFSNVAAKVVSVKAERKTKTRRAVNVALQSGEKINATIKVRSGSVLVTRKPVIKAGERTVTVILGAKAKARKARVSVKLTDASGVSFTTVKTVNVPKVIQKKRKSKTRK